MENIAGDIGPTWYFFILGFYSKYNGMSKNIISFYFPFKKNGSKIEGMSACRYVRNSLSRLKEWINIEKADLLFFGLCSVYITTLWNKANKGKCISASKNTNLGRYPFIVYSRPSIREVSSIVLCDFYNFLLFLLQTQSSPRNDGDVEIFRTHENL